MARNRTDWKPLAVLTLVVEFDELVDTDTIERIMDTAKEHGAVTRATFKTLAPVTKELV